MAERTLDLALGHKSLSLTLPDGVELSTPRPLEAERPFDVDQARAALREAWERPASGPGLKELAAGKRRAAILVGDLSLPGPYEFVLPELAGALAAFGIRPSRIAFLCRPGRAGPVLGRTAIRRYGERTVGIHELREWRQDEGFPAASDPLYEAADLRLAVLPDGPESGAALPRSAPPRLVVALSVSRGPLAMLSAARAAPPEVLFANRPASTSAPVPGGGLPGLEEQEVVLASGGGFPTDATLEEALLGLRVLAPAESRASTAVLAFNGAEGLGSSRFTQDLWALLAQAEALLKEEGALAPGGASPAAGGAEGVEGWEAAEALAEALCTWPRLLLFSPGLAEHAEAADWAAHLDECPRLAERLFLAASEAELWERLRGFQGGAFRLFAEPLGWRARR